MISDGIACSARAGSIAAARHQVHVEIMRRPRPHPRSGGARCSWWRYASASASGVGIGAVKARDPEQELDPPLQHVAREAVPEQVHRRPAAVLGRDAGAAELDQARPASAIGARSYSPAP